MGRFRKKRGITPMDMTPFIDIVFLLIIFFMVSTTFNKYGNIDTLGSLENAIITNLKTSNVSTNINNTNKLILYNTCYLWMYGNRKEEIKDSACEVYTALEHTS